MTENETQILLLITTQDKKLLGEVTSLILNKCTKDVSVKLKQSENVIDKLTIDIADYMSIKYGLEFNTLCDDIKHVFENKGL